MLSECPTKLLCYQRSQPYSQSQRIISYSPRALLCSQLLTFSELQRVLPCSQRALLCSQKVPNGRKSRGGEATSEEMIGAGGNFGNSEEIFGV